MQHPRLTPSQRQAVAHEFRTTRRTIATLRQHARTETSAFRRQVDTDMAARYQAILDGQRRLLALLAH